MKTGGNWFTGWVDAMAYFIIAVCTTSIAATFLMLAGWNRTAFAVGNGGLVVFGGLGMWLDFKRLQRRNE